MIKIVSCKVIYHCTLIFPVSAVIVINYFELDFKKIIYGADCELFSGIGHGGDQSENCIGK